MDRSLAAPSRERPARLGPLHHLDFRWLFAGVVVNAFGAALTPVALAFAVIDLGGTATELGLVVGAFALAEVGTVLFGGVLGDRVSRKIMMEGSSAVCALVQAVTALSLFTEHATIAFLTVMGMTAGVVGALAGPSSSAMTPLTVPPSALPSAIALRRLGSNSAMVAGFAGAGIIVVASGSAAAIAIDALTFAIAATCFSRLRVPHVRLEHKPPMLADLGAGAREVFRHTWLWVLIGQALLYHLMYGGVQGVLGPIVIGDQFGRAAWGWSLAALMAGFLVGGLVTLRWRPSRALLAGTILLAFTACFPLAMAWSPTTVGVLIGAFLHGFGLEIFSVWWDTSIQQNVAPDKLARVYSFDHVGSFAARPLGLVLTGPIVEAAGAEHWLVTVGIVMAASSLLATFLPSVRHLERATAHDLD